MDRHGGAGVLVRLFLPGGRSAAPVLSVHHRPLIAVEEHGDGAGAAVRADDRADVAQADPAAELREALLERVDQQLRILRALGVAHEAALVIAAPALRVLHHLVDRGLHGLLLAAHLAVGLDRALAVKAHDRADVHDRGDHRRRAGDAPCAVKLRHVGGEELVVYLVAVPHDPVGDLIERSARIAHVGGGIDEQAVARGGAERVDHDDLLIGVLLLQHLARELCVVHRAGLAGREAQVQQIAVLQLLFKEVEVRRDVDLRSLRELSLLQKTVKPGQGLRVAAHIVDVFLPVDDVGVKQHRDIALLHVAVGQIHRRAAAQNEFSFHRKLLPI